MEYHNAYRLVEDTAKMMGVDEKTCFEIATCDPEAPDTLWREWITFKFHHEITDWMEGWCLKILTGAIPLLPVPRGG